MKMRESLMLASDEISKDDSIKVCNSGQVQDADSAPAPTWAS